MTADAAFLEVLIQSASAGVDDHAGAMFLRSWAKETKRSDAEVGVALTGVASRFEETTNPYLMAIVNRWIDSLTPRRAVLKRRMRDLLHLPNAS